jgi:hypothetical protein
MHATRQPAEAKDIKIGMIQMQSFVMINKVRVREMQFDGGVVTKVAMVSGRRSSVERGMRGV